MIMLLWLLLLLISVIIYLHLITYRRKRVRALHAPQQCRTFEHASMIGRVLFFVVTLAYHSFCVLMRLRIGL
jgi:hypothetical protein